MQTTEPSLRVQTILDLIQSLMTDLALELRNDYDEVDVKLSVCAE